MSRPPVNREYPLSPEEMKNILQDCALRNGLKILFFEGSSPVIHMHIKQEIGDSMGDKYEAGQAGAQGPHAHAHDMSYNQIWHQTKENIDLPILAKELSTLRNELKKSAKNAEDYAEIGAIANAEIEAKKDDGPKALSALSKVGKKTLIFAEKIGIGVATAAIKAACGF